ncbi:response regulator transcription factor [Vallitalea pronyensis]|uniref:Stage 0 sporulation protein A homolog n=1 Tax=Vallitalea pronyensis TaxID=1348613 RepID=A0A8J8MJR2_9FIRM|nr:response regulator transcription factor [Vallitalea pronyensis]QUI22944.1 response regulator transcription factor [Vallitalea pronyensis]
MRIMIVDDDTLVSDGLKILIETEEDMEVVGVAANGREAFEQCATQTPDIVLMDVRMPLVDGIEGTKMIKEKFPHIKVLVLTTFKDEAYIIEAIKNGAEGYLLKNQSADVIIESIRTLNKGTFVCEKGIMDVFKSMIHQKPKQQLDALDQYGLSAREIEILALIAKGLSNKEIGEMLYIGTGTVRNYITSILDKLQLRDRTQLAILYLKLHGH